MSVVISRADILGEFASNSLKHLTLIPNVPTTKYNRDTTKPEPIVMYQEVGEKVVVPYLFAWHAFKKSNLRKDYFTAPLKFTGELRENQTEVELEAWKELQTYGTSTLGLYPGYGKTILGAKLASRIGLITLVLVHREILTTQWKKTFLDFTDGSVWVVTNKERLIVEERWQEGLLPTGLHNVIICMDTRWHLIPEGIRDSVGFLIVDEAHAFCTPTHVGCLLAFHPKYVLAESATLLRDDGLHSMIQSICGTHGVFRETSKPFSVMKITTNFTPERKQNRFGGVDYGKLVTATLFDARRNKIIVDLVVKNQNFTVLILTSLVDHAMLLHEELVKSRESCDYMCGSKKSYNDCRVLIGTTSKIGTGFDQATACPDYSGKRFDLLLLCCSIKKYAMLVQNVGRVFRAEYPTIMYLVDNDSIFTSHWQKAQRWFKLHGGKVSEYDIPNLDAVVKANATEVNESWVKARLEQLKNV